MADHSIRATLGKVFSLFDAPTRAEVRVLFLWMAVGAVLEMVGTAALLLFLDLVATPTSIPDHAVVGGLYRALTPGSVSLFLLVAGLAIAAFFCIKNSLLGLIIWKQNRFAQVKQSLYSAQLLRAYLDRPYEYHLNRNSAELLNKIVNATPLLFLGALLPFLEMTLEILRTLGTLVVLFATDPGATLGTAAILSMLAWLFFRVVQRRLIRWGAEMQKGFARCYRAVNQGLGSVKEAKVLGREGFFAQRFEDASLWTADFRIREGTVTQLPQLFLEAIVVAGLVMVIGVLLSMERSLDQMAPILSVFAIAAFRLIPSMNKIVGCASQIKASALPVGEVVADLLEAQRQPRPVPPAEGSPMTFEREFRLEDLHYRYPNATRDALAGVNLTLERGTSMALVGSSGAGKSTLADVLLGLLHPSSGRMLIDGRDVVPELRAWQARIGYVPQTIYLTDDSLRRNIALGLPDELIDEQKLNDAIRLAQLTQVVEQLPEGLETSLGELGVRLSGGQRQRVGIARALYHKPEVLVLDEATSALDNALEREVGRAIQSLSGKVTMIVIAHRLSTARKCDKVVLMKNGKVEDEGPFDELTTRSEDMRKLVELGQLN